MKFVNYKDIKLFAVDLKEVYTSVTEEAAMERLITFKEKWSSKYLGFPIPGSGIHAVTCIPPPGMGRKMDKGQSTTLL